MTSKQVRLLVIITALISASAHGYKAYLAYQGDADDQFLRTIASAPGDVHAQLLQAGESAKVRLLEPEHCLASSLSATYQQAHQNSTPPEVVAAQAREQTVSAVSTALASAMHDQPGLVSEATRAGADLSRVARKLTASAVYSLESAKDAPFSTWSVKDAVDQAGALSPESHSAADLYACALDAKVTQAAPDFAHAMLRVYSAMRREAQKSNVELALAEDVFSRNAMTAPEPAQGIARWRTEGGYVVVAELTPGSDALCAAINAAASGAPHWARAASSDPTAGLRRWSCQTASSPHEGPVARFDGRLTVLADSVNSASWTAAGTSVAP